jgi:hypothetical protein
VGGVGPVLIAMVVLIVVCRLIWVFKPDVERWEQWRRTRRSRRSCADAPSSLTGEVADVGQRLGDGKDEAATFRDLARRFHHDR